MIFLEDCRENRRCQGSSYNEKKTCYTVLHIINSLDDGGAEALLFRLVQNQSNCKQVIISLSGPGKYGALLYELGVEYMTLNANNLFLKFAGIIKLVKLIKFIQPIAVQTWMYQSDLIGGLAARIAGVDNVIWGIHNSAVRLVDNPIQRYALIRINALLSRVIPKKIVSVSCKGAEEHGRIGFDESRIFVVPNGYAIDEFCPDSKARKSMRNELKVNDSCTVIGCVARLDPQKDHLNLLNALTIIKPHCDFICVLVGKGVDDESPLCCEIKKRELETHVRLLGQRSDIPKIMNSFDIYVCSSYAEAFPNVICEAMSCGVPCVTTDVGDAAFIVGETGWVVPSRSSKQLAKALLCAMEPVCRTRQKIVARNRIVREFNFDKMLNNYIEIWSATESGK